MQLSDILEENSVNAISTKTNISEDNIELLIAEDFANLSKVKALGFISIVEREYAADLSVLRESALEYYNTHNEAQGITLSTPALEEKNGRSKWVFIVVIALLGYASWYFLTQFDKKNLNTILPFTEEKTEVIDAQIKEDEIEKDLSIGNAFSTTQMDTTGVQTDIVEMSIEPSDLNVNKILSSVIDTSQEVPVTATTVTVEPENRLWFGIIDMDTGKRDHYSIDKKYEIDIASKSWLVATSAAPFSFTYQEETQEFNDAKEHYFKVSGSGIESLSKSEYVAQGGYRKW